MTSFAKFITPASSNDARSPSQDFAATAKGECSQPKQGHSEMVAKDRPQPALRPSLDLAGDVDRAAFNEAWDREQRRKAFIKKRTEPSLEARTQSLTRTFNR